MVSDTVIFHQSASYDGALSSRGRMDAGASDMLGMNFLVEALATRIRRAITNSTWPSASAEWPVANLAGS